MIDSDAPPKKWEADHVHGDQNEANGHHRCFDKEHQEDGGDRRRSSDKSQLIGILIPDCRRSQATLPRYGCLLATCGPLLERNKEACDSFLSQLGIVETLDNEVAKIDVTRTPAYHELSRQAVARRKSLGHGGWGPYLKRINRSQRTINRAMTIFIAFPDKSKSAKWIALSLIDAEEEARNVVAKKTGKARTTRTAKTSEGQGIPKETPVVLEKSKSLGPKVNAQQQLVGSLADKQTIADSGSVAAKPQEQPAEASHVVPDAVAKGQTVVARGCFEEEVAR